MSKMILSILALALVSACATKPKVVYAFPKPPQELMKPAEGLSPIEETPVGEEQ